jgi:hypothetical protein
MFGRMVVDIAKRTSGDASWPGRPETSGFQIKTTAKGSSSSALKLDTLRTQIEEQPEAPLLAKRATGGC